MAAKNFRKLFEPYTVKSMTLRNRIVMTPIGTNFAEHTGEVNERIIDYYKQRAKGGTGLITIEAASVYSPQGASGAYQLRIDMTITFLVFTDYAKAFMTVDLKSASY